MDAPRLDQFAKSLAAPRTRRGALAALFGGALARAAIPGAEPPDTRAGKKKTRRKGKGKDGGVAIEGPCGDGGPKHNRCKRHRQCCTGYCERKKRCRCRRPGDPCTEDRNCCPERTGTTCQDGTCQLPASPCAPLGQRCSSTTRCCDEGQGIACLDSRCRRTDACRIPCDDGNPCTIDECDPVTGACVYSPLPDGTACPSGPNATGVCESGACQIVCNAGFGDCDSSAATGCEANLMTDVRNCGVCGRDCGICDDGTVAPCTSGVCAACDVGPIDPPPAE